MSVLLGLMCIATGLGDMLLEQYCHTKRAELFKTMNDLKLSDDMKAAEFFGTAPYTLRSITIQSVHRFTPTRIGFVTLSADIRNKHDEDLPGAAILMILQPSDSENSEKERWVTMVEQAGIIAGSAKFNEILAGMLDDNGDITAAAADELLEETEFAILATGPKGLNALAVNKAGVSDHLRPAMYPIPSGSDEFIAISLQEKVLDQQETEAKRGEHTG
ncbi:hypothetical protein B0J14DRAFT_704131 [Halenospora varia]|nr:hypothetical protein B0J14DRAFT_704131 [Halenospora varia]